MKAEIGLSRQMMKVMGLETEVNAIYRLTSDCLIDAELRLRHRMTHNASHHAALLALDDEQGGIGNRTYQFS